MTAIAQELACICREPVIDVSSEDHVARRVWCEHHRMWIAAQEGTT